MPEKMGQGFNSHFKTGRWSNQELSDLKKYIEAGLNYEQIAEKNGRSPENIKDTVEQKLFMNLSEEAQNVRIAEKGIKESVEWEEIKKQLSEEEQEYFLHHWRESVAQFKNDITHTEKLQLIDMIRVEIFINRAMAKIQNYKVELERLGKSYDIELEQVEKDMTAISSLQMQIATLNKNTQEEHKEYKLLLEKKQAIMKDIKGTRDQRVKRLEESKETFTSWMAALIALPELRKELGIQMEKHRLAKQAEYIRLSEYYQFSDQSVEQPLLTSDTVKADNV